MQYLVVAPDGSEYGPATVETLRGWASENRIARETTVKDTLSGQTMLASQVEGLFPPQPIAPPPQAGWSQPPSPYQRPSAEQEGSGGIWRTLIYSALAIVLFFVLHGIGLIFAIYGVVYAAQTKSAGHRYGTLAIVISSIALALVVVGWIIRLNGGNV